MSRVTVVPWYGKRNLDTFRWTDGKISENTWPKGKQGDGGARGLEGTSWIKDKGKQVWCTKKMGSGPSGMCVVDREPWNQAPLKNQLLSTGQQEGRALNSFTRSVYLRLKFGEKPGTSGSLLWQLYGKMPLGRRDLLSPRQLMRQKRHGKKQRSPRCHRDGQEEGRSKGGVGMVMAAPVQC